MNKQKLRYLVFGLLLLVLLLGFTIQSRSMPNQPADELQQNLTKTKLLSDKPQRIVSMSPGNTEILFALGAGDRVVGVTSYSDYPEEAKTKPSIGPYNAPDVEKVVAMSPDIVFAMGEIQAKAIRTLRQAGIPVISMEPKSLPEILTTIDVISQAIGEPDRGAALHAQLAAQLAQVQSLTAQEPPKRVFLEIWDSPLLTVGKKSFINDLIIQAGGINTAAAKDVDYTPCDLETLYSYNPDVYVVISHSKDDTHSLVHQPELADISAVQTGQVFQIDDDLLARPGPRSFIGLQKLAEILHPDRMNNQVTK